MSRINRILKLDDYANLRQRLSLILHNGVNAKGHLVDAAIVAIARSEIAAGKEATHVIQSFLATEERGSWGAQMIARALKSDGELLKAGLKAKIFRKSGPAPRKGPRKFKVPIQKTAHPAGIEVALAEKNVRLFAAAIQAELGDDALEFVERVYDALAN
jgi:hypothetical protein